VDEAKIKKVGALAFILENYNIDTIVAMTTFRLIMDIPRQI